MTSASYTTSAKRSLSKVALVTGGGRRIGAYIAKHLEEQGWQVIVHCHSTKKQGCIVADFSSPHEIEKMLAVIPVPDLIINNAAVFKKDSTPYSYERHMQINYLAPLQITNYYANTTTKPVCIINLLDAWASASETKQYSDYKLSKQKLGLFTREASTALPGNIRVNAIELGATLYKDGQPKKLFLELQEKFPTSLDDVSKVISYIIENVHLRGEVINIPQWKLMR